MKSIVKNLQVSAPGCNVGASCPESNDQSCGILRGAGASVAAPGQIVGDDLCIRNGASLFEVFRNDTGQCAPTCASIVQPGSASDCTEPFTPPVLDDLDGDDTPSCGPGCAVDLGDVAAACGVTLPLPACNPANPITVDANQDCGAIDSIPGNFRCDLPAGTYGDLFDPGLCS